MTWKNGSEMITFDKADMDKALENIAIFSDRHSPHFYLGERWFPVIFWHETGDLSFFGKDGDISLEKNNNLWIRKGVRLR